MSKIWYQGHIPCWYRLCSPEADMLTLWGRHLSSQCKQHALLSFQREKNAKWQLNKNWNSKWGITENSGRERNINYRSSQKILLISWEPKFKWVYFFLPACQRKLNSCVRKQVCFTEKTVLLLIHFLLSRKYQTEIITKKNIYCFQSISSFYPTS